MYHVLTERHEGSLCVSYTQVHVFSSFNVDVGGTGSRMKANMPKQFLQLKDRSVLQVIRFGFCFTLLSQV